PCGGAIPEELVSELKLSHEIIEREFDHLDLHIKNELIHRKGKGVVIWRDKFDHFITKKAIQKGAKVIDRSPCINVKPMDGGYKVLTPKDKLECRYLIAADGCNSTVLSSLGWPRYNSEDVALTVQYEMVMAPDLINDKFGEKIIHLFFGKDISKRGYGWIFPKTDIISVGWGCQLSLIKNTTKEFNYFIKSIKNLIKDAKKIKKVAHLVPTTIRNTLYSQNLFAIGDAAGFVDPLSGKGIAYSIISSEIAASIIKKYFNELNHPLIEKAYNKKLDRMFLSVLRKKKSIQPDVYSSDDSIIRFLNLWKNNRSSVIAKQLWEIN
ncbi:MAG: hypothetical protein GF329_17740, partial [Candidatus Lokiarchaeota archaeon]|nr:hypothetical protein [Candidatus Lokiarchaeota archaeon]